MLIIRCIALCGLLAASQHALAQYISAEELSQYTPLEREKWIEEEKPLKLRVLGGFTYDSNVFRQSDSALSQSSSTKEDLIYRVGGGARYEARESRQRFVVEGNVTENFFQNDSNLNNTSDDVRGEWLWQAGHDWNGNLGLGQRRYLENFANFQQNVRDMVNQNRIFGSANYLLYSRLRLSLNSYYSDTQHGEETRNVLDSKIATNAFTVNWVTPALNTVGLQYRNTSARYPNEEMVATTFVENAYHENEYSVVSHWELSGVSDLNARVGYTERKFDQLPNRNFSAPTWRLAYIWQASGKTTLEIATWREIAVFEDLTSNYVRATGVSIVPTWSITQQIALRGKASYEARSYVGDPGILPLAERREDKDRIYQISLLWTPQRLTELALTVESGRRTSNQAFAEYTYETVGFVATHYF